MKSKVLKKLQPDSKGRIALGKLSKGVDLFEVQVSEGKIILTPLSTIPISEPWLDDYPELKAQVLEGINQIGKGELYDLDEIDAL